ncbi:PH domain-containing protein [Arsenicicoccus dermatophilus]|uniref:PH domain-containing protein n=1 Tax=Arsenicicoccus dermatophilus TaxID=1076331 RepID=UPI001F4C7F75|nr:PH domain-containing protein [Arsenicicoccus dermatophilus]MCH8612098.1 PH domain-containing protein [Arsenicicoccus dermatophilus]
MAVEGDDELGRALAEPEHRVSPRARTLWTLELVLGAVVLLAPLGLWWWLDEERRWLSVWLLAAVPVLALAEVVVVPRWRYAVHRWQVTPHAVVTRSGWWTQERRVAPISRVQTVDLERGPLARMLGLATVTVTTASSEGAVELQALDLATAESLVAHLTRVTATTPGDAT